MPSNNAFESDVCRFAAPAPQGERYTLPKPMTRLLVFIFFCIVCTEQSIASECPQPSGVSVTIGRPYSYAVGGEFACPLYESVENNSKIAHGPMVSADIGIAAVGAGAGYGFKKLHFGTTGVSVNATVLRTFGNSTIAKDNETYTGTEIKIHMLFLIIRAGTYKQLDGKDTFSSVSIGLGM